MTVAQIVWVVAILAFLGLEVATPGALVSIWLMVGAIAALLISLITDILWVQLLVFIIVSAVMLAFTRPLARKATQSRFVPTNADALLGARARVVAAIAPGQDGRVHVGGLDWAARADAPLAEGDWCVVRAILGATLQVEAADSEAHASSAVVG